MPFYKTLNTVKKPKLGMAKYYTISRLSKTGNLDIHYGSGKNM
jgi:hypothetical protein